MAHSAGLEPAALGFEVRYSIQLSYECGREPSSPPTVGVQYPRPICPEKKPIYEHSRI